MNESVLAVNGLSVDILRQLSYPSALGLSLKKTLRHFDRERLLQEVQLMTEWLDEQTLLSEIALDYRIKSLASAMQKIDRYVDSGRHTNQVLNDILGFRAFCDGYDEVLSMQSEFSALRICQKEKLMTMGIGASICIFK